MIEILLASAVLAAAPVPRGAQDEAAGYEDLVAAFAEANADRLDPSAVVPPLLPDVSPFHAKFVAAARRHAGSEEALPYVGWLLQNAPRNREAHAAAVELLDGLAAAAAEALPDSFVEKQAAKEAREAVRHLKYNEVDDVTFARTLLDVKVLARVAESDEVRAASARSVYKLENLRPGMVAPDIVGKDLDGVEFKLSDYRGKVVVVDFWGDW